MKANLFVRSARKSTHCGEIFLENNFSLDVMNQTRWDSMFKMLKSLLDAETKGHLKLIPSLKHPNPRSYELSIIREVLDVLEPIHLFTLEFQAGVGTSGMVIPGLEALYNHLNVIDSDFPSMPQIILAIIRKRFSVILQDQFMIIANCIVPRFALFALANKMQLNS